LSFLGQYEHNLDAKDRLTVPSKFRAALADGVILAKGLEPSVWVFSPDGYEKFKDQFVGTTNPLGRKGRMIRHHFASLAFDDTLDSAGRIRVPKKLQEHAGLGEGACVVVGSEDWFEIWSPERWAAYEQEMDSEINEVAEGLSELEGA
jgi:MraZ protein